MKMADPKVRSERTPTIADLYLAFRQAKTAHYFERRGVGLLELAEFESKLPENLHALQGVLQEKQWFDGLDPGETWLVPKRLRTQEPSDGSGIVRIGPPPVPQLLRTLDIQIRLSPHPAFAIVEVLYLWRFGGILDSLLSDREVLGYRLDLREQRVVAHRRWLFEYWPSKYQQFRTAPLAAARDTLARGDEVLIVSGDLASFYDTVSPSFLLGDEFLSGLAVAGSTREQVAEFQIATASLIDSFDRFHSESSNRAGTAIEIGVPIGALTSRVIANLALAPFDRHISSHPDVLCYRRYVDDFVIVAKPGRLKRTAIDVLREFLPLKPETDANVLHINVEALGRTGSEFQLQTEKVRVHHLSGVSGADFVDAIAADFKKAVSERRAFLDTSALLGDGVTHLVRAGAVEGASLRVLRDADRARLERFALSTSLHSLERVSSLVNREEARRLVRRSLERVGRVLEAEDNWVDDLDVSLRLLKLALATCDWESARELVAQMNRAWGTVESIRSTIATLRYRGRVIDPAKTRPWIWLRNYVHERRAEAMSSAVPLVIGTREIEATFPDGLRYRTGQLGATAIARRARLLRAADLRSRDREDDAATAVSTIDLDFGWLADELNDDDELRGRIAAISIFVKRCQELADAPWLMPPARLFLCTRPPSYFDVARRWLYKVESEGFPDDVFVGLLAAVNAVRGTDYRDPVGTVLDESTVSIREVASGSGVATTARSIDPRVILGNLVVAPAAWSGAATRVPTGRFGNPLLTLDRLLGIARILEKAARVTKSGLPALLVLPELSVPRQWFRTLSNYVVRAGRFGLVVGLEYLHDASRPHVLNQVFAVVPGPFASAATWPWTKRLPARDEGLELAKLPAPVAFPPATSSLGRPRTVLKSPWGDVSVLICSEMIEARRVSDLLGRADVVLCPAWNPDTSSYDHLIQSVGFQLHAVVVVANNGHYSDCRAWAPRTVRWKRDLCRLIERDVDDVVHVDIPLQSLKRFHRGEGADESRPLPPDWP
jgi:hypothetical protein